MDCANIEEKLRGKSEIQSGLLISAVISEYSCPIFQTQTLTLTPTLHWLLIFVGYHLGSACELYKAEVGCKQLLSVTLLSATWLSIQETIAIKATLYVSNLTFSKSVNLHRQCPIQPYNAQIQRTTECTSEAERVLERIGETIVSHSDRVKYVLIIILKHLQPATCAY